MRETDKVGDTVGDKAPRSQNLAHTLGRREKSGHHPCFYRLKSNSFRLLGTNGQHGKQTVGNTVGDKNKWETQRDTRWKKKWGTKWEDKVGDKVEHKLGDKVADTVGNTMWETQWETQWETRWETQRVKATERQGRHKVPKFPNPCAYMGGEGEVAKQPPCFQRLKPNGFLLLGTRWPFNVSRIVLEVHPPNLI
jgi:hypothetical protein